MKIAITAEGRDPNSALASVFGRCSFFLIADTETLAFRPHVNPGLGASEGSGLLAARFVVDRGVEVVIAPKVGPLARSVLASGGLRIYVPRESGTASEALTAFIHDERA